MPFVPKIITGGKAGNGGHEHAAAKHAEQKDLVDITRLSRAFFRIRSLEDRSKIIAFIEEVADAERSEQWY